MIPKSNLTKMTLLGAALVALSSCTTPPPVPTEAPEKRQALVDLTYHGSEAPRPKGLKTGDGSHIMTLHGSDPNFYSGEILIGAKTWVAFAAPPAVLPQPENTNDLLIEFPGSDCLLYWEGLSYNPSTEQMKGRMSVVTGGEHCPGVTNNSLFSFYGHNP